MNPTIDNLTDLRNEIARLRVVKNEQEAAIKEHFSNPSAIISTVYSAFSGGDKAKGGFFKTDDLISTISRFVLPFALNKTIFRSSNFIIKAIVGVLSQSASGFINEKNVGLISGIVGAGGNLGGMLFGFLFKSKNISYADAFTYIGITVTIVSVIVFVTQFKKSEAVEASVLPEAAVA